MVQLPERVQEDAYFFKRITWHRINKEFGKKHQSRISWIKTQFTKVYFDGFEVLWHIRVLLFQNELKLFFPSWDSIDEHKELIRFAVCLSEQSSELPEVIYEWLAVVSRTKFFDNMSEDFLKSLEKEFPDHIPRIHFIIGTLLILLQRTTLFYKIPASTMFSNLSITRYLKVVTLTIK